MINFIDEFLVRDNFYNTNLVNFEFIPFRISTEQFKDTLIKLCVSYRNRTDCHLRTFACASATPTARDVGNSSQIVKDL